jgi:ABC-type arginine/histidine transport system permease subunit
MPYQSFEESQRFSQIWLWMVIIGVSIVMIVQVPLDIIQQSGSELYILIKKGATFQLKSIPLIDNR